MRRQILQPGFLPPGVTRFVVSLREDGFTRSVAVLAGGTATGQAINVLMAPVVTRLFAPADVGRIGLYLVFIDLASVALLLRLETALVSGRTDREAAQLAVLAFLVLPLTAVAASVLFYVLISQAIGGYNVLERSSALWMVLSLALAGTVAVLRYWLVRANRFRPISQAIITQNAGRAAAQVGFGAAGFGWLGLLAADLLGRGAGLVVTVRAAARAVVAEAGPLRELPARALLRRYWRFPVLALPSSFLDAFALALPIPLITSLYGVEAAGLFVLVQLVLALPTAVIGASVADAFHGRIALLARESPELAAGLFKRTGIALMAIGTPITAAGMLLVPFVFDTIFGEVWHAAGPLVVVMAPWALASLVVGPLSRVVFVYDGQGLKAVYDVLVLILVFGSLTWSAQAGLHLTGAVTVLSVVRVAAYGVYLGLLIWLMRRSGRPSAGEGPAAAA
ncbi:MAG TPA: oligosaccharide flippase family protein [Candidatus Limnocylindrales bacterium]|nr:oligosaccharide flippase family protein [Candidatus Limnocylindrales bacterium]